ncbi:hypothetical protein Sjap_009765 [Stephania japonica]|uniref:Uncharacterized protein n=1 Tax=Stephania japonica TaxID=461633 RepID=A0AAP0P3M3_9MAGN
MVSRFRRTLSFPTKGTPNPSRPSKSSYHVRSTSLIPCRSHPLISQLQTEIQELRAWTKTRACDGLVLLKSLHDSVGDLLQLPQTQDSLRRRPDWAEPLLDHFLLFADVFGVLRDALMDLKEQQLGAQVGARRRMINTNNEAALTAMRAYVKARKRMGMEVRRAAAEVIRSLVPRPRLRPVPDASLHVLVDGNSELAMILRDVHDVTVSSTLSILDIIVKASTYSTTSSFVNNIVSWKVWKYKRSTGSDFGGFQEVERMRKRGGGVGIEEFVRKLEEMEKCIGEMESASQGVFRTFLRARVSLLNILSQSQ